MAGRAGGGGGAGAGQTGTVFESLTFICSDVPSLSSLSACLHCLYELPLPRPACTPILRFNDILSTHTQRGEQRRGRGARETERSRVYASQDVMIAQNSQS